MYRSIRSIGKSWRIVAWTRKWRRSLRWALPPRTCEGPGSGRRNRTSRPEGQPDGSLRGSHPGRSVARLHPLQFGRSVNRQDDREVQGTRTDDDRPASARSVSDGTPRLALQRSTRTFSFNRQEHPGPRRGDPAPRPGGPMARHAPRPRPIELRRARCSRRLREGDIEIVEDGPGHRLRVDLGSMGRTRRRLDLGGTSDDHLA